MQKQKAERLRQQKEEEKRQKEIEDSRRKHLEELYHKQKPATTGKREKSRQRGSQDIPSKPMNSINDLPKHHPFHKDRARFTVKILRSFFIIIKLKIGDWCLKGLRAKQLQLQKVKKIQVEMKQNGNEISMVYYYFFPQRFMS